MSDVPLSPPETDVAPDVPAASDESSQPDPGAGPVPGDTPVPPYALYSRGQITGWALVGGPMAGAWFLSANYRHLGRTRDAKLAIVLGLVGTALVLALAAVLPDNFPNFALPAAYIAALAWIAQITLGSAHDAHLMAGGRTVSNWKAGGIAFAMLGAMLVAVVGVVLVLPEDNVEFGEDQSVYYEDGAGEAEARAVGEALKDLEYFDGSGPATVTVRRGDVGFVVAFAVQDGASEDSEVVEYFRVMQKALSEKALAGEPVELVLESAWGSTLQRIPWTP